MHPILAHRDRFWLYLGAWLPGSGLLIALVSSSSGMPWPLATALALPLGMLYAFVCLAAWYPCQAMPIDGDNLLQPIAAHGLAASISSSIWLVAGLGWAHLLDRLPRFAGTAERFRGMLVLFFAVGVLLYVLAVVVHYLLIAFEASRETESRNLELEVQAREAELRAMSARREQELAERELELARSIQRRLLPPAEVGGNGYRVAARNLPARFVAGDFYDVFELAGGKIGLVVADVAGKGIGASLITASVKAMTPLIAEHCSVTETLERLNDKLCIDLDSREFVALSLALFDPEAGTIELANSGLPDPYLMRPGCEPEMIDVPGPRLPLGIRPHIRYESRTLRLGHGERLLLLTDGLPEARTTAGEPLGYDRLTALLAENGNSAAPGDWLDGLLERVRAATTGSSEDDLTAVLLHRV
jgi:sigma-B regulation protein RsbU (phosphoserine phosphatase)